MSDNKPLVSVVMSCYNGEKYIGQTIESVLSQTYTNFEFIIWDDGSTDSSKDIVESYKDERIRYFYHENTGLGMALRLACEQAKGKYIARMDADDISLPERFEKEVDFLERHQECVLVSSAVRYIDKDGNELGRTFPCTDDAILKKSLLFSSMIVHPMVMMRREGYEKAGGYIPVKVFEDRIFWSRLAKYGKFSNITQVLGKYRLLNLSISHIHSPYSSILYDFRTKMIKDDVISSSDVELYNAIYTISRKSHVSGTKVEQKYKKRFGDQLFELLGGGHWAERLISKLKNKYYSAKL